MKKFSLGTHSTYGLMVLSYYPLGNHQDGLEVSIRCRGCDSPFAKKPAWKSEVTKMTDTEGLLQK